MSVNQWIINNKNENRIEVRTEEELTRFIFSTQKHASVQAFGQKIPCSEFSVYDFHLDLELQNAECRIIINWYDVDGAVKYRQYADPIDRITSPKGITQLAVSLLFHSKENGVATVGWMEISYLKPYESRNVTLAAIPRIAVAKGGKEGLSSLIEEYSKRIDEIAREKPDVVVLTEHFHNIVEGLDAEDKYITLDDDVVGLLRGKAREHQMYIACSIHRKEDENYYNTALLIDRQGELCGAYDKTHLTILEYEAGITPGEDIPVFDTDFGRVGFLICWDGWFPCLSQVLYQKGVEIILNPSLGNDLCMSQATSYITGAYLVSANWGEELTRIQSPYGRTEADAIGKPYAIATVDINMPYWFYQLSVGLGMYGEGRNIYRREIRPDLYQSLSQKDHW